MKILFIGAFNELSGNMREESSVAGTKVQMEIINSFARIYGESEIESFVLPEVSTWPNNKLIIRGRRFGRVNSLFTLNLKGVKRFLFSLQILYQIIKIRPEFVVQYNTTFLMNVFMSFYKLFCKKRLLILQDLFFNDKASVREMISPRNLLAYLNGRTIAKSFDYFIPISEVLIKDLNLPVERCYIWQGGVTTNNTRMDYSVRYNNTALFAGALEEYNGVDLLVSAWIKYDIDIELNIFGSGSLASTIAKASQENTNIKFHGFKSPAQINEIVGTPLYKLCLRFSKGIDQDYFFPSKFFDLLYEDGFLVCNKFNNIPKDLKKYLHFVSDDLSDLPKVLNSNSSRIGSVVDQKRHYLNKNYTWESFIRQVFQEISGDFNHDKT